MQPTQLYLDTAKLGRMSPSARCAHDDLSRLASDEAGSPFFDRFLRDGAGDWTASLAARYPGLAGWRGVGRLKDQLRKLVGTKVDHPILLASRSAQLMKLAARLFFGPCHNVLVSDLGWPGYHAILEGEARRLGRRVTVVLLRDGVLRKGWGEEEVSRAVQDTYRQSGCDGVFLSTVSNLGVRLPISRIVSALEAASEPRFVVLDGAQELNHVPTDLSREECDLYLAGAHKWLGAFNPLGLGFYGRYRSRALIDTLLAALTGTGEIDDPLLRLSGQFERDLVEAFSETVSLVPLFSCHGAVNDAVVGGSRCRPTDFSLLATLAAECGWSALVPEPPMQTAILLLQSIHADVRTRDPALVRAHFGRRGVALTSYADGLIRLSLPADGLQPEGWGILRESLVSVSNCP